MTSLIHWLDNRRTLRRRGVDRGATLVEYALIFSLFVVVSLVAIDLLTESASDEIDNQAECISDRPPPDDECGFAPVPEEIEVPDPGESPPVSAPPVEAARPSVAIDADGIFVDDVWTVTFEAALTRPVSADPPMPDEPVPGATVVVRIEAHIIGGDWQTFDVTSCITGAAGTCELIFTAPADVDGVQFHVVNVASDPPPAELPTRILMWRDA